MKINWYNEVRDDISKIPTAIDFFQDELINAKTDVQISGSIEKVSAMLPAIVENRFSQLQELEAILEYLNIELRKLRSHYFRKYLETYARALSSRDCEKYVDGENDIIEFEKLINEFALIRNKWLGVLKAIDVKQWQVSNIVKLRAAGLDDAAI